MVYSCIVLFDIPPGEVDIAKQLPRPDLVKEYAACSEAISSKGFEAAYKHCAKFGKLDRQPCYSMSSLPRKDKGPASFTQPGEFNVNLDCVRPRLPSANYNFEVQPGR